MVIFFAYLIISVVFSVLCYRVGKTDSGGNMSLAGAVFLAFLWPVIFPAIIYYEIMEKTTHE